MEINTHEQMAVNETAVVSVSKDLLSAYLTFAPPVGGIVLAPADIIKILFDKKIVYGIDQEKVNSLASDIYKKYNVPHLVAVGVPPENGIDAKLEFKFSIVRDKTPKLLPDGTVDHKALNYIQNVRKGDLLAAIIPETPGINGKNVFGIDIKAKPGRPRVMPKGKNTEIGDDKNTLVAAADGTVEIIDGRITVSSLLEIKGDVGPATGHIIFAGDVRVSGNVLSTYNITAEGSIQIGGVIESSEVRAGHDITIDHGIKGSASQGGKCEVYAGGNITSKFIENATVFAAGTIRTDSIIHSKVTSYDTILVWGRTGNIIGGAVRALKEIICDTVGSSGSVSASKVILESGLTDTLSEEYNSIKEEIERLEGDTNRFRKIIKEMEHLQSLNASQAKRMYNAEKNFQETEMKLHEKQHELMLIIDIFERQYTGSITINKRLFPPIHMTIDKQIRVFDEASSGSSYRVIDHEIMSTPI